MSINERFLDFQVVQSIRWYRYSSAEALKAAEILGRVDKDIEKLLRTTNPKSTFSKARLVGLKKQVESLISDAHGRFGEGLTSSASDAAITSAQAEVKQFIKELPTGLDVTTPNLGVLQVAATAKPFSGAFLKDWIADLKTADLSRSWRSILDGITAGSTTDEIISRLLGTKALKYKDGVREVSRRGATALVRTAINHATNAGRQLVWESNQDLVKGVRWVSTLDTRTSPLCRDRDGEVYPVDSGPRPPAHANCRSTTVAVLKSWKELGFDMEELPAGTRASMDGQVPANMTYWEWFKRQNQGIQEEILGKKRLDLWKAGKEPPPTGFTDDGGNLLSLQQLKDLSTTVSYRSLREIVDEYDQGGSWKFGAEIGGMKPAELADLINPKDVGLTNWDQILARDYDRDDWAFATSHLATTVRSVLNTGLDSADAIWNQNLLKGALELNTKPLPKVRSGKLGITQHLRVTRELRQTRAILPDWMLRQIGYGEPGGPDVAVEPGIRAFAKGDRKGGIHVAVEDNWSVYVHEMFHELDHRLQEIWKGGNVLKWRATDSLTEKIAEAAHQEFLDRDSKGFGTYTNGDGKYALGNWRKDYEGRIYKWNETLGVSSEYLTVNSQFYYEAYLKGPAAFFEEREKMKRVSPKMLALLDHIAETKGGWNPLPKTAALQSSGLKPLDVIQSREDIRKWTSNPEQLMRMDPTEFGLTSWPDLSILEKGEYEAIADYAHLVVVNQMIDGGRPRKYQTLLRQRVEKLRSRGLI